MIADLDDLRNWIRQECERVAKRHAPGHRFGLVSSYDPSGPAVRVTFPEDLDASGSPTVSPWMPIVIPSSGPSAGVVTAPNIGDQAMIIHFGWGADRFTFMLGTIRPASDAQMPPTPLLGGGSTSPNGPPAGEVWVVHKSGTYIKITTDGSIKSGGGPWSHVGDLDVSGTVRAQGNIAGPVGYSGSFTTPTGQVVTAQDGRIVSVN